MFTSLKIVVTLQIMQISA